MHITNNLPRTFRIVTILNVCKLGICEMFISFSLQSALAISSLGKVALPSTNFQNPCLESIMCILNFQRWKLPPSNFSMTFKDSIWKENILNTNVTINTLFKRLKALQEIFNTSHKLEKKRKLLTLTNLLLHKLEISLETCNNGNFFFWHTWNFTLSTVRSPFFHTLQTFNESKNSLPHTFWNFKVEILTTWKTFFQTFSPWNLTLSKTWRTSFPHLKNV